LGGQKSCFGFAFEAALREGCKRKGRDTKENLVARIYDAEQNTRDTENVQLLKPGHAPVFDSRKFG
jgi:hypothetical protein